MADDSGATHAGAEHADNHDAGHHHHHHQQHHDEQQPLLSDNDHGSHTSGPVDPNVSSYKGAKSKDGREDWHWLERLVFKDRLHFFVSVCFFFVFWTFIALIVSGDFPWDDHRWPWYKEPDYFTDINYYNAVSRLQDQPFCFPDVQRFEPADVSPDSAKSLYKWRGGSRILASSGEFANSDEDRGTINVTDPDSISWRCMMHGFINQQFSKLPGSKVLESAQRQRDSVHAVMSIAQGDPFYSRSANASHPSPSSSSLDSIPSNDTTFRSPALYQTMEALRRSASQRAGKKLTLRNVLGGFNLSNTRHIREHTLVGDKLSPGVDVIETNLMDAQKFAQSLVAIYHGIVHPSDALPIDSVLVQRHLMPIRLNSDGSTAQTNAFFDLVRKDPMRGVSTTFSGVGGRDSFHSSKLQSSTRPYEIHTLNDRHGDHEMSIALNLNRGLVSTAIAHLSSSSSNDSSVSPPSAAAAADAGNGRGSCYGQNSSKDDLWNWMNTALSDMIYQLDQSMEIRLIHDLSGTYRYERPQLNETQLETALSGKANKLVWMEVDVQIDERSLWITRIEYQEESSKTHRQSFPSSAAASLSSSSAEQVHFSTDEQEKSNERTGPVSVLRKYNVGGTADFLAGWTCRYADQPLADCYRPRVGDDDSKCNCHSWLQNTRTTYRVGLWPVLGSEQPHMYEIPRSTIRLDTNSYMDQAVGGCPSLWRYDPQELVPEMEALGYRLRFTEPVYKGPNTDNGTVAGHDSLIKESELHWLDGGVTLKRVGRRHAGCH